MILHKMHITPGDYLHTMRDDIAEDILYISPMGPHQINEMSDYIVIKDAVVGYHEHDHGYETFFVDRGSVECFIAGKHCVATQGDFVHIQPFVPHSFKYLEEGTIWRELFTEMNMYGAMMDKDLIMKNCPEKRQDEAFMARYRKMKGDAKLPEPDCVDVDKKDMPFIRAKGEQLGQYPFEGITFNLKIGRWELGGIKEVWEQVWEQGYVMEWNEPHPNWDLFVVKEGRFQVEAGDQSFVAEPRDIINIPPYTVHKITALESGGVLHDYNCQAKLLRLLESIQIAQRDYPEKLEDHAWLTELREFNGCYVTGYHKA